MKAYSGILQMKSDSRRGGRATVDFDTFAVTGDATVAQGRQAGGSGKFRAHPAFIVSWREYTLDDSGGGSEKDEYILNSTCDKNRLTVDWKIDDSSAAAVFEISFLVIGE